MFTATIRIQTTLQETFRTFKSVENSKSVSLLEKTRAQPSRSRNHAGMAAAIDKPRSETLQNSEITRHTSNWIKCI